MPVDDLKERVRAIEMAAGQIEKQFGKGSIMRLGAKDAVACRIHAQWDVGEEADSTYVPSDVYQVLVRCERVATEPALKDAD